MKGSILDLFFVGRFILALVLIGYILYYVIGITTPTGVAIAGNLTINGAAWNSTNSTIALQQTQVAINNFMDTIPFVVGGIGVLMIIAAALLPIPAVFLPIGILMFLIACLVFFGVQWVMPQVFANSVFTTGTTAYSLPMYIAENVGWIVLVFAGLLMIILYSRFKFGGNSNTPEG